MKIISPIADLRETPTLSSLRGKMESQLIYGETFSIDREENGWCYGVCAHDGYKGWIEKNISANCRMRPIP